MILELVPPDTESNCDNKNKLDQKDLLHDFDVGH